MDLDRYVAALRAHLGAAAGDDASRPVAERLGVALDPAVRLVLLEALSDAAGEITSALAPGAVEVRLRGRDPELVVTRPADPGAVDGPVDPRSEPAEADPGPGDDTSTTRTTLRLPDQVKARVERAAAEDGVSVNTWLVRAVSAALEPKRRRAKQRDDRLGDSFTGWVR